MVTIFNENYFSYLLMHYISRKGDLPNIKDSPDFLQAAVHKRDTENKNKSDVDYFKFLRLKYTKCISVVCKVHNLGSLLFCGPVSP